jgi:hypothetical protein
MSRLHIFADEAGDFTFARNGRASRYFIVCTVAMHSCGIANDLLALRRNLAWKKAPLGSYFHAAEDKQAVRDEVFSLIGAHGVNIYATIMEESKAQLQVRISESRFYKYGWLYLLLYGTRMAATQGTDLLITAASIETKAKQGAFTAAVNDVVQQTMRHTKWVTHFCPSQTDPCLQVADYCTWAIQRKWERNDTRSYDLIKPLIRYEYDLWQRGATHYY